MNRLLAFILLIALHIQPAVNLSIWMDYAVNFEHIKEVLCINKNRPKLQCNGKCYLMQQLKKTDPVTDKKEMPITKITKVECVFFSTKVTPQIPEVYVLKHISFLYKFSLYKDVPFEIFHPPRFYVT